MTDTPYADVEKMLATVLEVFAPAGSVDDGTRPFVRVMRIGGADDGVTDRPRVVVDVLADTRDEAWSIARALQQYLTRRPRAVPGLGIIDRVTTDVGPQYAPHEDARTALVTATYIVASRRSRI